MMAVALFVAMVVIMLVALFAGGARASGFPVNWPFK